MGKYIRKCRGGGTGSTAAPAVVVAGVRTRSRSAAETRAPAPKRPRKTTAMRAEVQLDKGREDGGGGCYLQLRSRRLFMVAAEVPVYTVAEVEQEASPPVPLPVTGSTASEEDVAVAAGVSRCSSTASSSVALREMRGCAVDHQARENGCEESSVSDDSGCGREWREATPSSRAPRDLSDDQESSKAVHDDDPNKRHRSARATVASCSGRMPPAEEIEEFFAAAEKAEAERFAVRYNFDVVRGVPLNAAGGRFEWTPVADDVI